VESDEQHPSFMKELVTAVAYLEPVLLLTLQHALNRPLAMQAFEETLDEACKQHWLMLFVDEKSNEPMYTWPVRVSNPNYQVWTTGTYKPRFIQMTMEQ
jgi:hypothetical protein